MQDLTLSPCKVDAALDACVQGLGYGKFLGYQVGALVRAGRLRYVLETCEPEPMPVSLVYPRRAGVQSPVTRNESLFPPPSASILEEQPTTLLRQISSWQSFVP